MHAMAKHGQPVVQRRKSSRHSVIRKGRILLGGVCVLPCIVLNTSEGGAKILLTNPAACPRQFDLEIGADRPRPCRLIWSDDKAAGVQFAGEAGAASDRRTSRRILMLWRGEIVPADGGDGMACAILELASGGARLRPASPAACPSRFQLRMLNGPSHDCEVVRRADPEVVVRFAEAIRPQP